MPNYEKNSQKSNFVDISSNKQVKKLYNKKGRLKRILCLVFSIIFLLGGGGMLYYYSFLDTLNFKELDDTNNNTAATNSSVAPLESDATNLSLSEGELLQNSKELNVMLFGEDNSKGDKHGRSDTMIMMTIDNNHKKLKLTSFQRDTYVYIPGYGYDKLNASYNYGGAKLSIQTIEANFGIKVDRYAVVDFDSFKKIIDTLGGVWKLLRTKLTTSTIRCTRTIRLTQEQLSQTHPVLFISTVRRLFGMLETEALQRARTATKSVLTVTTGTEPQDRENFLKLCSQV